MKTVLIIDDEVDLCAILTRVLIQEDFTVDCVHTLHDADLKLMDHPQIVILDNNLPDGSGLDYFVGFRSKFEKSLVVLISADLRPEMQHQALRSGIDAFIQKPFSTRMVRDTIRQMS